MTAADQLAAARRFVNVWGRPTDPDKVAAALWVTTRQSTPNCRETEALVELFEAFGQPHTATQVLAMHTEYDDCTDDHHPGCANCGPSDKEKTK